MALGLWRSVGTALLLAGGALSILAVPAEGTVLADSARPADPIRVAAGSWELRGTLDMTPEAVLSRQGPFGAAPEPQGGFADRWRAITLLLQEDVATLAACRAEPSACTDSARRFGAIVEEARLARGRARLGSVNRAVNLAVAYRSDMSRFGIDDVWSPPLATFAAREGDCEDYAIAKYLALREAGTEARDLRLAIVREVRTGGVHAVLAVWNEGDWLLLDNAGMALVSDTDAARYRPLAILGAPEPIGLAAGSQDITPPG